MEYTENQNILLLPTDLLTVLSRLLVSHRIEIEELKIGKII